MKNLLLLFLTVLIASSCKKNFATLSNSDTQYLHTQKAKLTDSETANLLKENEVTSQSSIEPIMENLVSEKQIISASISNEMPLLDNTFDYKTAPLTTTVNVQSTAKNIAKEKSVKSKRIKIKDVLKVKKELKRNGDKGGGMGILSLIFGIIGTALIVIGAYVAPILIIPGFLLGLLALIFGIIGVGKRRSSKAAAIVGLVFGSIITLGAIIGLLLSTAYYY